MENNIKLSVEQQRVIDFVRNGTGNLIVNAMAGSGKTTTIVETVKNIPMTESVLFVAFNRSIVKTLKEKLGVDTRMRKICTYHSLGYSLLRNSLEINGQLNIDEMKYRRYIFSNVKELCGDAYKLLDDFERKRYINNLSDLVDYSRYNLMQSEKEVEKICLKYGIRPVCNECSAVVKVLNWGQSNLDEFDYTDLIWLPIELNINCRWYQFDWVFIDEAQDSSPCQQALFKKCLKSNGRCVMVGDNRQCINGWCGSDVQAFKTLHEMPNTIELPLSISYRCPRRVIYLAQQIVPEIKPAPWAENGEINYNVSLDKIKPGDAVLCRTTEPLVRLHMKFLEEGKKSFIVGRTYGKNIIEKIKMTGKDTIGSNLLEDGIVPCLYFNLMKSVKEISAQKGVDETIVCSMQQIVDQYDQINAISILSKGLNSVDDLIARVNEVFISDDTEVSNDDRLLNTKEYVTLSTIHKAKGLEFDNVFLACPSILPSPLAEGEEELQEEENLKYVAITRAKKTYNVISQKELPPTNAWNGVKGAYDSLINAEPAIVKLYGSIPESNIVKERQMKNINEAMMGNNKMVAVPVVNKKKIKFKNLI